VEKQGVWRECAPVTHGGISFELAALVFEDTRCLVGLDRIDETGEQRWHVIGAAHIESEAVAVLLVVNAYREDCHGEEIIRRYREQAMD
jgi:uncharacterized DUF497 family protein